MKTIDKVKAIFAELAESKELLTVLLAFADERAAKKKPLTENAARLSYKKLLQLSKSQKERVAIVEQTIACGYQGFFPLKKSWQQPRDEHTATGNHFADMLLDEG